MMKLFKLLTMAALVALSVAACDEGETGLTPDAAGTISGRVTVDGTARTGVVVTLTGGRTATTNATGNYSFADVAAGAYTVSIPAITGVQFPFISQGVVIATQGQVATVDFAGSAIRNSSIVVSVAGSSGALANVTVSLTGAGTGSATTNAGGVASFTGLATGTYTVAISGVPAGQICAVTSQATTVPAGETRSLSFTCTSAMTSSITGRLFLDERNKNNVFDGATLEGNLMVANVAITLEGPTVGVVRTTQTDASGNFSFTSLAAGQYNVSIDSDDPDLPGHVAYGLASETIGPITLAAAGTATANFAFDIVGQTVLVYAFLGRDANAAPGLDPSIPTGIAPVEDVIIELYPTEQDADNGTNRLARDTTNASGQVQLTFDRASDRSPGVGGPDNIVFARIRNPLPAGLDRNGESQIEIAYDPTKAVVMAPDTFDLLNPNAIVAVDVVGINGQALAGWGVRLFDDTTAAAIGATQTNAAGRATFVLNTTINNLPEEYFIRLANAQAAAGTHQFQTTPVAQGGASVKGRYLAYNHTGTAAVGDTMDVGNLTVRFTDSDLIVRVFHERDDTLGFTAGDNTVGVGPIDVTLSWVQGGADSVRMLNPQPDGVVNFLNVPTGMGPYTVSAAANGGNRYILQADSMGVGTALDGGVPEGLVCPLGEAIPLECGTFAFKYDNGTVTAVVQSNLAAVINGIRVRIAAHPMTLQPNVADTTVTMTGGLAATNPNRGEGYYIVTALDSVTAAGDTIWKINNPRSDTVDLQGNGSTVMANFTATRMDTEIRGLVVNDRDGDQNTIDPNEGLAGVILHVYRDGSGAFGRDTLVATDTTDANGAYQFTRLREGRYMVKLVAQPTDATVLRGFMGAGGTTPIDSVIATTTSATAAACADADNLHRVGEDNPACFGAANPLPAWDYANNTPLGTTLAPTHFTFLHRTGTATGTVLRATNSNPIVGMSVVLRRCLMSAAPANPTAGTCATYVPGFVGLTTTTDSTGRYTFSGLQEGVYEVTPQVGTGSPGTTAVTPANSQTLTINQPGDVETANFTATP